MSRRGRSRQPSRSRTRSRTDRGRPVRSPWRSRQPSQHERRPRQRGGGLAGDTSTPHAIRAVQQGNKKGCMHVFLLHGKVHAVRRASGLCPVMFCFVGSCGHTAPTEIGRRGVAAWDAARRPRVRACGFDTRLSSVSVRHCGRPVRCGTVVRVHAVRRMGDAGCGMARYITAVIIYT